MDIIYIISIIYIIDTLYYKRLSLNNNNVCLFTIIIFKSIFGQKE